MFFNRENESLDKSFLFLNSAICFADKPTNELFFWQAAEKYGELKELPKFKKLFYCYKVNNLINKKLIFLIILSSS